MCGWRKNVNMYVRVPSPPSFYFDSSVVLTKNIHTLEGCFTSA